MIESEVEKQEVDKQDVEIANDEDCKWYTDGRKNHNIKTNT